VIPNFEMNALSENITSPDNYKNFQQTLRTVESGSELSGGNPRRRLISPTAFKQEHAP